MILNTKQFWSWWTTELRSWMTEKFSSVIEHIPTDYAKSSELTPLAKDTTVAKETNATSNKQEILNAIGSVPTPVIPTDYAKEQTLTTKSAEIKQQATANKQEILAAIGDIDIPTGDIAKESTLQGVVDKVGNFTDPTETVAHKLENINIDTTELAKQGTDSAATLTATQAYAQQAAEKVVPTDYAKARELSELATKCDGIDAKIGYAITEIDAL